jgi:CheY-like chemotaxis protein
MVKSQPGEGTSFRVYLPPACGGAAAEAPRADRVFAGSGTILVVDDEPLVRDVATRSLERAGYRVVSCESGEAALARVDKGGIDGIVLDLTMPGMGGKRAFEEMRRRWADLPIVMSSGFTEDDAADRILREPKVGFIQKPYTAEQLAGVVRDVVGK